MRARSTFINRSLRTPHCYYSAFHPETGAHVLLEDLAPASSPAWEEGCTLAQTEEAIRQISHLHAHWWESPLLSEKGIGQPDQTYLRQRQESYQTQAWHAFLTKVGEQTPPVIRELGKDLGAYFVKVFTYLQQPPVTLTHFDYKPSNFFFDMGQEGVPFAVVNWQLYMRHRGVFDMAYLLSGGVKTEARRQKEQEWLTCYHTTLCEQGVRNYSLFDYCLSLLRRFMRFVMVVGNSAFAQEQEQLFYRILLPRTCSAMLDFDVQAVLAQLDGLVDNDGLSQTTIGADA